MWLLLKIYQIISTNELMGVRAMGRLLKQEGLGM
jgi:hypothetical protein